METRDKSPRIRVQEVAHILGCGVSTVWAWVRRGHIPPPKRVGSRFSFWLRSEIEAIALEGGSSTKTRSA